MKLFGRILLIIGLFLVAGAAIYFLFPGVRNNYPTFAAFLLGILGLILAPFRLFFRSYFKGIGPSEKDLELQDRMQRLKEAEQELWNRLERERELHEREIALYEQKITLLEQRRQELDEVIKLYSDPKKYYEDWMKKTEAEREQDAQQHLGYIKKLYEDMQKTGGQRR